MGMLADANAEALNTMRALGRETFDASSIKDTFDPFLGNIDFRVRQKGCVGEGLGYTPIAMGCLAQGVDIQVDATT